MSINPMSDEWEGEEAALVDLTRYITAGTPRFIRIRTQRDQCVVVTEDGKLYTFKRDKRDFVPEFPVDDVFKAVENKSWIEHVNAQRTGRGFAAATGAPRVTCVEFLIGDITLLIGDSLGGLQGWFSTKLNKDAPAGPLNRTRIHSPGAGAIAAIVMAQTQKSFVITDESGLVRAIHNTSEREFFNEKVAPGAVRACSPLKEEGFIAVAGDGRLHHWWVHAPHVDVSLGVLIAPVWYESYPGPVNHWESTTGSADVESKYSLVPLIIGTLKGGLYALLVAIPLALLGAVYTSEFMHRKMRAVVKPSMEIMASLPSVVLGFLAAMYFAPEAAPRMPTLIVAAFVCPGFFLLYGWMFQQLPPSIVSRFTPVVTTVALFLILMAGLGVSSLLGPRFEQVLFPAVESADPALVDARTFKPVSDEAARRLDTGDFRSWTSGGAELAQPASVRGETLPRGWWIPGGHTLFKFLMWIPFGLLLAWALKVFFAGGNFFSRPIKPVLPPSVFDLPSILNRARGAISGGRTAGLWPVVVNVGFSLAGVAVIGALAFGVSSLLSPMIEGLLFNYSHPTAGSVADFRRFVTGPEGWKYTQTNSLIVGFAMGFAVIPIIYSIAEDALSTVPNHMRAASLACGASRWQTTVRIVIPAAASGIFSAIVIGLGRAVGETMIVVMAAGGTPVMDMQPLVGFRSLSAAIATEIAEAADGSTHRRTLFLAGLVLFLMTFFMSTLAEFVRMRLRKKLNRM
ncbi:MAG: ABC transporter permease subunit [Planctomycetes bacterium]|nr:ABC transporter permease subunit [Planctomycetota bacterium]